MVRLIVNMARFVTVLMVAISMLITSSVFAQLGEGLDQDQMTDLILSIASVEYKRIAEKIPFGSEWEITLSGEEKRWSDRPNSRYSHTNTARATASFRIPPLKSDICEDVDLFILSSIAARSASPAEFNQQEFLESIRFLFRMMLTPEDPKVIFRGSADWWSESSFWRSSDGSPWIKCDACPRVTKQISFPSTVSLVLEGITFPGMGVTNPEDRVVGADPPPTTCVRTFRNGFSDRSTHACDGYGADTIPVISSYWDIETIPYKEGRLRVEDYQSSGPAFHKHLVDVTLRQKRPRNPLNIKEIPCFNCDDHDPCTVDLYRPGKGCVFVDKAFYECEKAKQKIMDACKELDDWMVEVNRSDRNEPIVICEDAACAGAISAGTRHSSGDPFTSVTFSSDTECSSGRQSVCEVNCYGWQR